MIPIEFKERNRIYTAPRGMSEEECGNLPIYQDEKEIISCWKMNLRERIKAVLTGKMWFSVMSSVQPPICLSVDSFFTESTKG